MQDCVFLKENEKKESSPFITCVVVLLEYEGMVRKPMQTLAWMVKSIRVVVTSALKALVYLCVAVLVGVWELMPAAYCMTHWRAECCLSDAAGWFQRDQPWMKDAARQLWSVHFPSLYVKNHHTHIYAINTVFFFCIYILEDLSVCACVERYIYVIYLQIIRIGALTQSFVFASSWIQFCSFR